MFPEDCWEPLAKTVLTTEHERDNKKLSCCRDSSLTYLLSASLMYWHTVENMTIRTGEKLQFFSEKKTFHTTTANSWEYFHNRDRSLAYQIPGLPAAWLTRSLAYQLPGLPDGINGFYKKSSVYLPLTGTNDRRQTGS